MPFLVFFGECFVENHIPLVQLSVPDICQNELSTFNSIVFYTICCGPRGFVTHPLTESHYVPGGEFYSLITVFVIFLGVY